MTMVKTTIHPVFEIMMFYISLRLSNINFKILVRTFSLLAFFMRRQS